MFIVCANKGVQDIDDSSEGGRKIGDRSVLPPQESFRTCFNSIRNDPHLGCSCVPFQDVPNQVESKQESQETNTEYQIKFHAVWTAPFKGKLTANAGHEIL